MLSGVFTRRKEKHRLCEKNVDLHDFFGYNEQA